MSSYVAADAVSNALPIVVTIAVAAVVALSIAGWVIRDVARTALQKTSQDNVPHVLAALGSLLEQLRLFFPWQRGGR